MTSERVRRAGVYATTYCARVLASVGVVALFLWYLAVQVSSAFPGIAGPDLWPLAGTAGMFALRLVPLVPLSFAAGLCDGGTRARLAWRVVMNAYLVLIIAMFSGYVGHTFHGMVPDASLGVLVDSLRLTVDTGVVGAVLLCAPACSLIDAFLEYHENRTPPEGGEGGGR